MNFRKHLTTSINPKKSKIRDSWTGIPSSRFLFLIRCCPNSNKFKKQNPSINHETTRTQKKNEKKNTSNDPKPSSQVLPQFRNHFPALELCSVGVQNSILSLPNLGEGVLISNKHDTPNHHRPTYIPGAARKVSFDCGWPNSCRGTVQLLTRHEGFAVRVCDIGLMKKWKA